MRKGAKTAATTALSGATAVLRGAAKGYNYSKIPVNAVVGYIRPDPDGYFTQSAMEECAREMREHIGLGQLPELSIQAMEDYKKNRPKDLAGLGEIKGTGADSLLKELQDKAATQGANGDAQKAIDDVAKALEPEQAIRDRELKYAFSLTTFHEAFKKVGIDYTLSDLLDQYAALRNEGLEIIAAQQANEKAALDAADTQMSAGLGITADVYKATVKPGLMAALDKKHQEQKAAFDKTWTEQNDKLKKAADDSTNDSLMVAFMYKYWDKNTREYIKKAAEEQAVKVNIGPAAIGSGVPGNEYTIQGVTMSKLFEDAQNKSKGFTLKTINGKPITVTKDANGNTILTFRSSYASHLGINKISKSDFISIAQMIRSQGHKKIEMTVNFADEKTAMEQARGAFEACRIVGYPPDAITIVVKGKTMKAEDLFKDAAAEQSRCEQNAGRFEKGFESALNIVNTTASTPTSSRAMRQELDSMRNAAEARAQQAAAPGTPARPSGSAKM